MIKGGNSNIVKPESSGCNNSGRLGEFKRRLMVNIAEPYSPYEF